MFDIEKLSNKRFRVEFNNNEKFYYIFVDEISPGIFRAQFARIYSSTGNSPEEAVEGVARQMEKYYI